MTTLPERHMLDYWTPHAGDHVECYCCTCPLTEIGAVVEYDRDCRLHGDHGSSACPLHASATRRCTCPSCKADAA